MHAHHVADPNGADCRLRDIHVRQQPFEVCAASDENHDADWMRDRVFRASEVAIDGEEHVESISGELEKAAILHSRPPELLNCTRIQVGQRPHEAAWNALVNEKPAGV